MKANFLKGVCYIGKSFAKSSKILNTIGAFAGGSTIFGILTWQNNHTKIYADEKVAAIDTAKFMAKPISDVEYLVNNSDDFKTKMELLILRIQKQFCTALEKEENGKNKFVCDRWSRHNPEEGGGITCVLQDGEIFEKAGVNITVMRAPLSKKLQESMRSRGKDLPDSENYMFFAAGISSVVHPRNPHIPTIHFNYRYFEIIDQDGNSKDWWYGGGTDLTPYYLDETDVYHFHKTLNDSCETLSSGTYIKYKKWCDQYFYNSVRNECRGVGGIFFDDLYGDQALIFNFITNCAESVIPSFIPIVKKNRKKNYNEEQRRWQLLRRGRYVEFNLIYDRGTKFGFATPGARIESILMSLPLTARWEYMHIPEKDTEEGKLLEILKNPKEWL